jgi:hypothetical protein
MAVAKSRSSGAQIAHVIQRCSGHSPGVAPDRYGNRCSSVSLPKPGAAAPVGALARYAAGPHQAAVTKICAMPGAEGGLAVSGAVPMMLAASNARSA